MNRLNIVTQQSGKEVILGTVYPDGRVVTEYPGLKRQIHDIKGERRHGDNFLDLVARRVTNGYVLCRFLSD